MSYYILQQMVWFVKANENTGADFVEAYNKIYYGKKIADYAAKRSSLTDKEIDNIVNSIEDTVLKGKVEHALDSIKKNNPNAYIFIMKVIDGQCVIMYNYTIKATVVKTIDEIERDYVRKPKK